MDRKPARVGICIDERFLRHHAVDVHPERPERLAAIRDMLSAAPWRAALVDLAPRDATRDELLGAHQAAYLDELAAKIGHGTGGWIDPDTYYSADTLATATLAAGSTVELAMAVADGRIDSGFAIVRPPGHHATSQAAMGFCFYNNVAVAAAALRAAGKRVAILDWDVHHGNGTEEIALGREGLLFISLHEWPQYPGTGPACRTLTADGAGLINLPLPAGTEDERYLQVIDSDVLPAIAAFRPDVILISAGFDGHRSDPLGGFLLTEQTYAAIVKRLQRITPRIAAVLEGGYDLGALGRSVSAVMEALLWP